MAVQHTTDVHNPRAGSIQSTLLIVLATQTCYSAPYWVCPGIREHGATANLTCISGRNETTQDGDWRCIQGAATADAVACHIPANLVPTCDYTVAVLGEGEGEGEGEEVSLTVNITDYHCSETVQLTLVVGNMTIRLANHTVTDVTDNVFNVSLRDSHVEEVSLLYDCGPYTVGMSCGHLQEQPLGPGDHSTAVIVGIIVGVVLGTVILEICRIRRSVRTYNSANNATSTDSTVTSHSVV